MRIIYQPGDLVVLIGRLTTHRVIGTFEVNDQASGEAGQYQYLSLDPEGPPDVFGSTDARNVVPAVGAVVLASPRTGEPFAVAVLPPGFMDDAELRKAIQVHTPDMGCVADIYAPSQYCPNWDTYRRFAMLHGEIDKQDGDRPSPQSGFGR